MTERLEEVQAIVAGHMDSILSNFKHGAKITVLVRTPGKDNADFCMTNDDLDQATAMIERRKQEHRP